MIFSIKTNILTHFTSPRFTSPRFTSPRFTGPVHEILYVLNLKTCHCYFKFTKVVSIM